MSLLIQPAAAGITKLSELTIDSGLNLSGGDYDITMKASRTIDGKDVSGIEDRVTKKASDVLRHSIDAESHTTSSTYQKVKTLTFTNGIKGVLRIKGDLKCSGYSVKTQLTKDGATPGTGNDLGTEQSSGSTSYATVSQDASVDIAAGETIDVWLKQSFGGYHAYLENWRFYYDNDAIIATTGGD